MIRFGSLQSRITAFSCTTFGLVMLFTAACLQVADLALEGTMAGSTPLRVAVVIADLAGLALVIAASRRLGRRIVSPIGALEAAAEALARGETSSIPVTTQDEIGSLTASFNAMSEAIASRERDIRHMAYHDALTDLPNRSRLREELDGAIARLIAEGGTLAAMCLDLDNFKHINDTLGHQAGDDLLQLVARRLSELAPGRFIARTGGDEFCVLVVAPHAAREAEQLAATLIARFGEPFMIDGHLLRTGISAGIAVAPHDTMSAEALIRQSDLALYAAKTAGRSRFRRFTRDLDREIRARRSMELDLHDALADGEFALHFQPLFDLSRNCFSAFEALLRWNHPRRGQVLPAEFIPVAEETGLIIPIGEWVLREACRHAATWPEDIRVAVNFSTVQFSSPGLVGQVAQTLAASGLDPNRLEIEITESLLLESSDSIRDILLGLKALGVRIALDDFGTGFSSLSFLRKFPFDKIKIDRSFIIELLREDEAGAVVRAITDLATALKMETTAEGVEESGQVEALRAFGCTTLQGYLFSRPVPPADIPALLARGRSIAA
ncbi:EAL domain-containing protein [Novosphingobium flavum]|uniref:EAL domain-containing protein n=1 Tax=Novosphingobium flavum TaxID=1778672 RepID=A0A7X1FSH2_9SPHN|nr:EAL domain-containing protein [Novosphingobium flavum]MBC2666141.1 EAL domain-containing protein [Novosphingobium flavum]